MLGGENMTQEEMGNAILKIQETLTGMKEDITGMKEDITGMKEDATGMKEDMTSMKDEGKKRDDMLLNVQNILLTMQQENKTRFDGIDERMDKMDARFDGVDNKLEEIANDVSENLTSITSYFSRLVGGKNVDKFESKSHTQILEDHEKRISPDLMIYFEGITAETRSVESVIPLCISTILTTGRLSSFSAGR